MARKALPEANIDNNTDEAALASAVNAAGELGAQYQLIAAQFGYGLAYNKDRMVDEVRHYLGESARTMLEAGARLALIRSQEPHGEWDNVCQGLGIERRTANRMIAAASKFSNGTTSSQIERLGTSKMFELLLLDDADAETLTSGGSVEGLGSVDDISNMTVKELRAALRDQREENKATQTVLTKRNNLIDQLQTKAAKVAPPTPDEEGAQLRRETGDWAINAEGIIRGSLRDGLEKLQAHAEATGTNHEEFASGLLAQLSRAVLEIRTMLMIKEVADGNPQPAWDRDA